MNKFLKETGDFVKTFRQGLQDVPGKPGEDYTVALAPQSTHLLNLSRELEGSGIELSGQNCGVAKFGAYTGEISAAVLRELGCKYAIVGHSERRHVFKEDDALILSRLKAGLEEGLKVIFCVGEVLQERKAGKTFNRLESQLGVLKESPFPTDKLSEVIIAYEPVWAIGTGETATVSQVQEVHTFIRSWIQEKFSTAAANAIRIQYGGSVKPENAGQIMAQQDVDGLLVGTASLDPSVFAGVIRNGLKFRT
jgi:triosephosphate isomerase